MDIIISNSSGKPIYEQIASQIKAQVITGQLREGEALPSMRLLARELRISLITTKRAYEELEREGFLYTMTGKGSFVAARNWDLLREEQRKRLEEHLHAAVQAARLGGVDRRELLELTGLLYDEEAGQAEDLSAPPQE